MNDNEKGGCRKGRLSKSDVNYFKIQKNTESLKKEIDESSHQDYAPYVEDRYLLFQDKRKNT